MTRLTHMILGTRDDLHIEPCGDGAGNFGYVISLGEYHRPLISCDRLVFKSAESAMQHANEIIKTCREFAGVSR